MAPSPAGWRDRLFALLVTCGGLGYAPRAPGTFGSLMGVTWFAAAAFFFPEPAGAALFSLSPLTSVLVVGLLFWSLVTVALGGWAEKYFGKKDWGGVVSDEAAGFLLTVLLCRWPSAPWTTILWAFPLWRFFDIVKLPPARQLERLPRGWGVLADDLASACYAAAALQLVVWMTGEG